LEHNINDSMQYVRSVAGDSIITRFMWMPRSPYPTDFSRGDYLRTICTILIFQWRRSEEKRSDIVSLVSPTERPVQWTTFFFYVSLVC